MKDMKRILCLLLTMLLLLECVPGVLSASAAQEDGLCETHHAAHDTAVCGYVAEVPETPCTHPAVCDDNCKTAITNCVFVHEDCGCTETETCDHLCTQENGCITLVCSHTMHDEACGYEEAQEGQPCSFAGKECVQCAAEQDCSENCTNPDAHEGDCTLECGCPVTAEEHLETCDQVMPYNQTLPMYACITGDDGNGNVNVTYLSSMTNSGNSVGPWLTFVPSEGSDEAFTGFTSSNTEVVTLEYAEGNSGSPSLRFLLGSEGTAVITHTEGNKIYTFTVTVTKPEDPVLRYRIDDMGPVIGGMWQLGPNSEGNVKFYIGTNNRTNIDQENGPKFSLTNVTVADSTVLQLVGPDQDRFYAFKALKEGSTQICATVDGKEYSLEVYVQEPTYNMVPVQPEGPRNNVDLIGVENPMDLRFFLSLPDSGPVGSPLMGVTSSDESVFTLTLTDEDAGIYTLTPVASGTAKILYSAGGKNYSCDVVVLDKHFKAEGLLYYPAAHFMSGKTYPKTVTDIPVGGGFAEEFFYSQPEDVALLSEGNTGMTPLTINDVTWSGPINVVQPEGDTRLHITGTGVGTGYLEVTDEDGIVHCFVVNVGTGRPNTEIVEGGYMWLNEHTVLGFGNPGIASNGDNNAEEGDLKLRSRVNSGFGSNDYPEEFIYREPVAFAAMDQTNGKPDASVMAAVENVTFSVLVCKNTDGTSGSYASVENEICEQVTLTEGNVKAWTNYIVAGGTEAFKGLVGMTFDLPETRDGQTITRRISLYITLHNTFMGEDVRVTANVTSAKQLNVILSSYEALKTWVKKEYPQYADAVDNACNVNILLPSADLTDAVVVSETIAPFPFRPNPSSNPNFRVFLIGPEKGSGATLAGLISRGSLAGVFNVNFQATNDVTMTLQNGEGTETFTCGLMADSTWSGTVKYDMDFAKQYGIDPYANKRNLSSWTNDSGMHHADCDILSVEECSFEGFDYGTRSTPNGYVGGGAGNSFKKCFFGIYIDCEGKPGWGDIHYTGFSGYNFKNTRLFFVGSCQNNAGRGGLLCLGGFEQNVVCQGSELHNIASINHI